MPIVIDRKKHYTVEEVAEKFEVHPTTINRLARENIIKGEKYNVDGKSRWLFVLGDLEYLKDCRPGNPSVRNGTFWAERELQGKRRNVPKGRRRA